MSCMCTCTCSSWIQNLSLDPCTHIVLIATMLSETVIHIQKNMESTSGKRFAAINPESME